MKKQKNTYQFKELVAHCGGKVILEISTHVSRGRQYCFGVKSFSFNPVKYFGVSAGNIRVFIGADREGMFGRQCPKCKGHWRSSSGPSNLFCPYCSLSSSGINFLTEGQKRYIDEYYNYAHEIINTADDGEYIIDMDAIEDSAERNSKPVFYYSEEKQQKTYTCLNCNEVQDILGRYGYCSKCGTHNGLQELKSTLQEISNEKDQKYETRLMKVVSEFSGFARKLTHQLAEHIPAKLKKKWKRELFHNLKSLEELEGEFKMKLFEGMSEDDKTYVKVMFCRRHIYEHGGNEVDQQYINDSGDTSVRLKEEIHESHESVSKLINLLSKIAENFHKGFHEVKLSYI